MTPGNVADGVVAAELIEELVAHEASAHGPGATATPAADAVEMDESPIDDTPEAGGEPGEAQPQTKAVYGDCAYGTGQVLAHLNAKRIDAVVKSPRPQAADGHFTKDDFEVDLETDTVRCPNGVTVAIAWGKMEGQARFGKDCAACPLRDRCTNSTHGRGVNVGLYEAWRGAHAGPSER